MLEEIFNSERIFTAPCVEIYLKEHTLFFDMRHAKPPLCVLKGSRRTSEEELSSKIKLIFLQEIFQSFHKDCHEEFCHSVKILSLITEERF